MELLVRAGRNDHTVMEKLCAPASAGLWPRHRLPLSGLVADAQVAAARPQLRKTAAAAGIPFYVDPLTPLLQDEQAPGHPWARLALGDGERHAPADFDHFAVQDELVERTVDFQREHGATAVIPPYFYSPKRGDAWFELNIALLARTARYLERADISLPVVPVFAASLMEYGPRKGWASGMDRFLAATDALDVRYVALSWSAASPGHENEAKLAHLLTATRRAADHGPVLAWRQGLYGLASSAVGAAGYECGAAQAERCHYPDYLRNRRPSDHPSGGPRGSASVYLSTFGRSVSRPVGTALLASSSLRGSLICTDPEACCADGVDSMVTDWREHAVRNRARELAHLERMPHSPAWRLTSVGQAAERARADARLANTVLSDQGLKERLPESTFRALAHVTDQLRNQLSSQVA